MTKTLLFVIASAFIISCGSGEAAEDKKQDNATADTQSSGKKDKKNSKYGEWETDQQGTRFREDYDLKQQLSGYELVKYTRTNGGQYGGSSSTTKFSLCSDGSLKYYYQSLTTISVEGAGGSDAAEDEDYGSWKAIENEKGLKINGHWDEELHALDYLVYSYLQNNNDAKAKEYLDYVRTINVVSPANFKVFYAFAAIPARYALERKDWKQAAELKFHPAHFAWNDFPWQKAIIHFARTLGNVHLNNIPAAEKELDTLRILYDVLKNKKNKANEAAQVSVQTKASEAWIEYKKANKEKALELMKAAATAEDAMEKHPVTPGAILPARELLGEMLLATDQPALAINEFEQNLKLHVNRRNGLIGLNKAKAAAKK